MRWRRTMGVAIAAACLTGVAAMACVGSDPDPVAPTPDATPGGGDDADGIKAGDGGADAPTPVLGCNVGGEIFDFCDSFDGPEASFVPPWDTVAVSDGGRIARLDGSAVGVIDLEQATSDAGPYYQTSATIVKTFAGDIGTFVLERRVRVRPRDGIAGEETDPGVFISQVLFQEGAGGSANTSFIFPHLWRQPTADGGTFEGGMFRVAYVGLNSSLGGSQQSDNWTTPPRVGQWYLVRDTYELSDSSVKWTVAVDGVQQVHTEKPMALPHMQLASLVSGPSMSVGPAIQKHAGWVVEVDDVHVAIKARR